MRAFAVPSVPVKVASHLMFCPSLSTDQLRLIPAGTGMAVPMQSVPVNVTFMVPAITTRVNDFASGGTMTLVAPVICCMPVLVLMVAPFGCLF